MDRLNYTQAAKIIFNHRSNRLRIKILPPNCRPNNFEDAYKIQDELKKIYMSIKDNFLIGKKVGCTNEWAQKQINVNEPFYGNIFSKYSGASECTLLSKNFSEPYFESEFSFKIKEDINIAKAPYNIDEVSNLVESVMASIEIVDFRFKKELKDVGIYNLIAANGASEFWIKSKNEFNIKDINLSNHPVKVYINGKLREEGNSSNVLSNPLYSLQWLINTLASKGEILLKNNLVSTGTCTVAIPLKKNSNIKVDFANMGDIDFEYI